MISHSKPKKSDTDLKEKVKSSFESSRKTYGTRRIKSDLEDQGITVSRRKIGQIMQKYKLISKYTLTAFKPGKSASNKDDLPNIVNQEFSADRPMQKLTTDLTYIRVSGKCCYACLILDLYNREIVGWSVGSNKNADLVLEAMKSIPYDLDKVEVFHTDRGAEFVNKKLDELLADKAIERSLSAPGVPYDNAVSERTYRPFKTEFVNAYKFKSSEQLALLTHDYIHWWNHKRKHSTLNNLSPLTFKA